ncbi:AAA family ATPase [sulfur-oxidizing endosymbiont of Gigantopelta aegis]|uniref:AAA family ATPase n=1 Tax=sulfur-oxidizing endosymbiont of Gigantopelta aegis TaxID=2794934 RepID=UPI0018DBE2CB|nr:MoxR family ATPase [sulfur-oxidizing endosymbiont of Gigantopelta aegis]
MLTHLLNTANTIISGKEQAIKLSIACLLSKGHLLIEDLPGMGKTTLAHLLAKLFGLDYSRIQFTSDMLPADIIGVSIFDRNNTEFQFHPGPVFSQLVLADEINRATAKTQSALLEAMEEQQITMDGKTYPLDDPFFVIATQNPQTQAGTFSLPESQLDRFLMRIVLGYPDRKTERGILSGADRRELLKSIKPSFSTEQLLAMQKQVREVHISSALLDYVQDILQFSRQSQAFLTGLSPRAGLALLRAAQAWAFIHNREMVIPDDIKAVLPSIILHRLVSQDDQKQNESQVMALFDALPIP